MSLFWRKVFEDGFSVFGKFAHPYRRCHVYGVVRDISSTQYSTAHQNGGTSLDEVKAFFFAVRVNKWQREKSPWREKNNQL
jgi:hypothetical protein